MTDRHLDEGIIQAYIDGELSQEHAAATAGHLAACEACSAAHSGQLSTCRRTSARKSKPRYASRHSIAWDLKPEAGR